jgi:hypothetical protein
METMYTCPTSSKTCFTFGPTPGVFTLAPEHCSNLPAGSGVSSVAFAPLPNTANHGPFSHLPISDDPVVCDGKLVLKVRQLPDIDSSNYSKCFQPGAIKRTRDISENGSISIFFNPPIKCKLSDNQDGPADAVAVAVEVDAVASHAAESLANLSRS